MKLILTKTTSTIILIPSKRLNLCQKINKKKILFRIEVEEVIAYSTFDQNQDGLVSQDEINVS